MSRRLLIVDDDDSLRESLALVLGAEGYEVALAANADEALARLDDGTFGTCVRCGQPIAAERLEALPWAPRCIDCQRLADRER